MLNKDNLTEALAEAAENPLVWRSLLALVALLSFLLPWITMDGNSSSTSGSSLAAHLFHGTDRGHMFSVSFTAAITLLTLPFLLLALTAVTTFKTVWGHDAIGLNAAIIAVALLLLIGAKPLASTAHTTLGGITQPHWGIIMLSLTQLSLAGHSLWEKFGRGNPGPRDRAESRAGNSGPEETSRGRPTAPEEQQPAQAVGTIHMDTPGASETPRLRRPRSRMPADRRRRFSERMVQRASGERPEPRQ